MVAFAFLCFVAVTALGHVACESIVDNYPTAHTQNNRIMGFILNYGYDHIDPLLLIFNEYVSMCEGGWDPTVVLHTTKNWTQAMHRYVNGKSYCYRTGRAVKYIVDVHDPSVGTSLASKHKKFLREEINNFDFFVYHEDDIIFKYSHLVAYLNETRTLHDLNPETGLKDNVIGFQRYRRLLRGDIHSAYGETDIFEQEMFEELPSLDPICIKDVPYLHAHGNTHQAIWAFTAGQIRMLQTKCNFMDHEQASREFMSSFLVYEHKGGHCAMNKLIPASRLSTFAIWHYYQQKHVSWTGVFQGDEHIHLGRNYNGGADMHPPDCWKKIVEAGNAAIQAPAVQ